MPVISSEEMGTGPEAASTMILLIFAGQRVATPERHEVDPSGASLTVFLPAAPPIGRSR